MTSKDLNEINPENLRGIPLCVLLDLDLSANALRLYGIIEQMESCHEKVFLTMEQISEQLGIKIRQAQHVSKELISKGYVEHFEDTPGCWVWKIKPISSSLDYKTYAPQQK